MTKRPCPGEEGRQDPRSPCSGAVCAGGPLGARLFSGRPEQAVASLDPKDALLSMLKLEVKPSKRQMQGLPQACVLVCWTRLSPVGAALAGCSRPGFPGSLMLYKPHFSCFYKQWQDLQIYKSINGLYSPISHFNNTRSCLQSVDSFSLVPKARSGGEGRGGGSEGAASLSTGLSWVFLQSLPRGPVQGWHLHHQASSVQKPQARRPQVYLVNELLVGKGILVVK